MISALLTKEQIDGIRNALTSSSFSMKDEVQKLVTKGLTEEEATRQIQAIAAALKQELFEQKVKTEEGEDYQKLALAVVIIVGLLGPIFDISSALWYITACLVGGGVGYWAYKDKPIAGMLGCACAVMIIPFSYSWYVMGRESIIKIEMLIPVGLALLPSYFIGWLTSKILYADK